MGEEWRGEVDRGLGNEEVLERRGEEGRRKVRRGNGEWGEGDPSLLEKLKERSHGAPCSQPKINSAGDDTKISREVSR